MKRKIALVTGAGRGIGYAIARQLIASGYDVSINYRSQFDKAAFLREAGLSPDSGRIATCKADITDFEQIQELFKFTEKTLGTPQMLVNNAGITEFTPLLETTPDQWDRMVFTDWKGAYFCTQFAAKGMIRKHLPGTIINISSNHADGCWPDASIYGPVKCALTKFGRHAAMELAPYNIRVITIAPGYTDTGWGNLDTAQQILSKLPMKRFASPEEIAAVIPFLDSESAAYMTGCCITIDGGALLAVVPENNS